jgi:hypothetical protein
MNSKVKNNAAELAQILQEAEVSGGVSEARDALVEELLDDPVLAQIISTFRSLVENHSDFFDFHHNDEEAFLYYQLGDHPDSVSPEEAPYTAVVARIHYSGNSISAKVYEQDVNRRGYPEWIPDTPYEIFINCYYQRDADVHDIERFIEAKNKERLIEKITDSLFAGTSRDENRGYFVVNKETGEVVKEGLTEREARNLTAEDLQ